jgi:hypothetical protein
MDLEDAGTRVKFVLHDRDASFTAAFDADHFRVLRRDRAGGVIHEYRLVAYVFGTRNLIACAALSAVHCTRGLSLP